MIARKRKAQQKMAAFRRELAQLTGVYGDGYTWPRGQAWQKSFASKRSVRQWLARVASFTVPISVGIDVQARRVDIAIGS